MSYSDYWVIKINDEIAYVNKDKINELRSIDSIIFDCDGVLIDTRNSYDLSIKGTLNYIFKSIYNENIITDEEIYELRLTGLFNNDWDLTYIIALSIFAHLTKDLTKVVITDLKGEKLQYKLNGSIHINNFHDNFKELIKIIQSGTNAVNEYIQMLCKSNDTLNELNEFIALLGDPEDPNNSMLAKLFDSMYYGKNLYEMIYNSQPLIYSYGLIKNELVLVNSNDLKALQTIVKNKKFLLLTGRSKIATKHVLESLSEYFDFDSSIFIEDLIRSNKNAAKNMKKPSELPLIKMSKETSTILYVGDSTEDMLMVKRAKQKIPKLLFAGITGVKENPNIIEEFFINSGADIIVRSVKSLVRVLHIINFGDQL